MHTQNDQKQELAIEPEQTLRAILKAVQHSPQRRLLRAVLRQLLQKFMLFPFLRHYSPEFEVSGLENLNAIDGPCVFVSNHSSHADTAIILCALPETRRTSLAIAAAADYFYKSSVLGYTVTLLLNTFPFERNNPRQGLSKGRKVLQSGQSLLIYPEGTRSKPSDHVAFKRGFAALACQQGLPVIPIYIEGSYEMLPKGTHWPRRSHVHICFGAPVFPCGQNSTDLAHLVEEKVHSLAS